MSDRLTTYDHDGLSFDVRDEGPLDGDPPCCCTVPRAELLVARGGAPAARRRAADLRTRPARLLAGRPAVAAPGLPDVAAGRRRGGAPRGDRPSRAPRRPRLGRREPPGRSRPTAPTLLRSLTAVSVPHPPRFLAADGDVHQGLVLVRAVPAPVRASSRRARRGTFDRALRRSGMTDAEVERFRTEIVEYGALPGGLAWYRGTPFGDEAGSGSGCRRRWCGRR